MNPYDPEFRVGAADFFSRVPDCNLKSRALNIFKGYKHDWSSADWICLPISTVEELRAEIKSGYFLRRPNAGRKLIRWLWSHITSEPYPHGPTPLHR